MLVSLMEKYFGFLASSSTKCFRLVGSDEDVEIPMYCILGILSFGSIVLAIMSGYKALIALLNGAKITDTVQWEGRYGSTVSCNILPLIGTSGVVIGLSLITLATCIIAWRRSEI